MDESAQAQGLQEVLEATGITLDQLWLYYISLGGTAPASEVKAYVQGTRVLPVLQRDVLAHAANELAAEVPSAASAPYSRLEDVELPWDKS